MRLLLCTAPMVQINTPYPATAYLTAYLQNKYEVTQDDLAIKLFLRIFSRQGILEIAQSFEETAHDGAVAFFLQAAEDYAEFVEPVVDFLQGKNPALATRIAARTLLPEGPRFLSLDPDHLSFAFGSLGVDAKARHIASLFLDDIADVIRHIDADFAFARYGEQLAASQISFHALYSRLNTKPNLIDRYLIEITREALRSHKPNVVGISVPFSGAMYGALRIAKTAKELGMPVVLGGGYVNTELRDLSDPRVFEHIDYICFDDGEVALDRVLQRIAGKETSLLRTKFCKNGKVLWESDTKAQDLPFSQWPAPTYRGLELGKYVRMLESLNPVQRLWTDFHWNKITIAHGCYWKKCSFCDTNLDYIGRYESAEASRIVDRIESVMQETGQSGFHFVDEAAPPKSLEQISREILRRRLKISWWGNLRFEKTFNAEIACLMAEAGCIAVTGGLEVASPRILDLIQKGVTIPQVARVTRDFSRAGISVHAYLMYGFPTQTTQETIDSLEVVRQLFVEDCIQSGFWHRFALTVHSPIARSPQKFGIEVISPVPPPEGVFAKNDVDFLDPTPTDHDTLGEGLNRALFNYMHEVGLEEDVRNWFSLKAPKTTVHKNFIRGALSAVTTRASV